MKKLNRLTKKLMVITAIFAVVYVASAIIVGSMCVNLNVQKQKINKEINALRIKNEALSVEVNSMGDYNNVVALIQQEGLTSGKVITLGR